VEGGGVGVQGRHSQVLSLHTRLILIGMPLHSSADAVAGGTYAAGSTFSEAAGCSRAGIGAYLLQQRKVQALDQMRVLHITTKEL
jgi:hypothetical protein